MAKKIIKKEKEKQKKMNASFSRRVGLLSGIAVLFTLVIDAFSLFWDTTILSIILGFLMLFIALFVMTNKFGKYLDEKINRKDYLANVIDTATLSSVFAFAIERLFLPAVKLKLESPWMVLVLIVIFIALPIIVGIALFTKEDAKHHVEE